MVRTRPLQDFTDVILRGEPLTFSCWGKHEWQVLFGECNGYVPRDGHFYFSRLCSDMTRLLLSRPGYSLGLSESLMRSQAPRINAYLGGLRLDDLDWCYDVFEPGGGDSLSPFLDTVAKVRPVLVGPPRWRRLRRVLDVKHFVDVPPRNQYLCKDDIVRDVLAALEECKKPALVTVSAGVISPLVIDSLHRRVGGTHQLIDVGNLWEAFARG